jgi:hypothetical protein
VTVPTIRQLRQSVTPDPDAGEAGEVVLGGGGGEEEEEAEGDDMTGRREFFQFRHVNLRIGSFHITSDG